MNFKNYKEEMDLLLTIPGIKKDSAAIIIAEIGVNMEQFPTSQHLASWARVATGYHEKCRKAETLSNDQGKSIYIKSSMCGVTCVVSRCRDRSLAAKYWPIVGRRGKKKALIAYRLLKITYSMLINSRPIKNLNLISGTIGIILCKVT